MKFTKISVVIIIVMILNLLQPICVEATSPSDVLNTFVYQYTPDELLDAMESAINAEISDYQKQWAEGWGNDYVDSTAMEGMKNAIDEIIRERKNLIYNLNFGNFESSKGVTYTFEASTLMLNTDSDELKEMFGDEVGAGTINRLGSFIWQRCWK